MSERLDRIEDILLRVVEQQSINQGEIAELKGISQNFSENLMLIIEEQRRDREEFRYRMDAWIERQEVMQSEIRGLQVENHRILERLESHASDGHGN